jgi:uncharacterized RDD family membrane protein YckC
VLTVVAVLLVNSSVADDLALLAAISILITAGVLVGYPVTFETLTRGRSLGKLALGLRVVREDGGPIRFRQALVRGLTGFFVDFWVLGLGGVVAVFVSLASAKGKRVGDYLAGTVVIQERIPATQVTPPAMPVGLAGWAAGLNVAALPDGLALAVRQYLARYSQLDPGAREVLGARLAAEVCGHLGLPVSANGWAPEHLAAVLAERRAREEARVWAPAPHRQPGPRTASSAGTEANPFAPPS